MLRIKLCYNKIFIRKILTKTTNFYSQINFKYYGIYWSYVLLNLHGKKNKFEGVFLKIITMQFKMFK